MIQRIQSIFLFLASLLVLISILVPMHYLNIDIQMEDGETAISAIGLTQQTAVIGNQIDITVDYYKVGALSIIGLIAFITIFLFKNRGFQMRLIRLNIAATLLFIIGMAYFFYSYFLIVNATHYSIEPAGCIVIAAILLFNILALRFIRKDDNLVKSVDRFR